MSSISAFITSPAFVDAIILVLIFETIVVCTIRWRSYTTTWWRPIANNIAGIFLLLALRSVLAGSPLIWMLLAMSGALAAHLIDLKTHIPHHVISATTAPKGIR